MNKILFFLLVLTPAVAFASNNGDTSVACCGVVIFILIVIGIKGASIKKDKELSPTSSTGSNFPPPAQAPSGSSMTSLHMVMIEENKDLGAGSVPCFVVKIQGRIQLPPNILTAVFSLSLWDETLGSGKDKMKPVFCSAPELCMVNSQIFLWTHIMPMQYSDSVINEMTTIISIPVDMLIFPARGERVLHFHLSIAPLDQIQNPTTTASFVCMYTNNSLGYVDGIQVRIKAEELGLKYAAAVSAVDGSLDSTEKRVIRKWMDSRIDSLPEEMKAETTRSLSRALMLAERLASRIKPDEIEAMCHDIVEEYPVAMFPRGDLYDIVELCMKVAAADGVAGPEELELITSIAEVLGVDQKRFRVLMDKILPVNMHSSKDVDTILGIKEEWTVRQKKKHLRELYREWSARVTHSEVAVRDQADEMLRLIAERRAEIDDEG